MPDTPERLAVVETRLNSIEKTMTEIQKTAKDTNDVIQQLKGAKYVGWFIAAGFGYLIHTILPFLQGKN